jgi:hypothetical protein
MGRGRGRGWIMGTGMGMGMGTGMGMGMGTRYQTTFSFISSCVSPKYPVRATATYTSLNKIQKVSTHRAYSWHPKYYCFIFNTMTVFYITDYAEKRYKNKLLLL